MKTISETFNPYEMIKQKNETIYDPVDERKSEQLVNEIYISLCAIFKGCWVSNHQDDINAYKKQLFLAFQQFEINKQEQIEKGLFNARKENLDKFPKIKQVVEWCLDKTPNKPEYHKDYKKLGDSSYSPEEIKKHQEIIKPEYKDFKSPKSAFAAMKELLK